MPRPYPAEFRRQALALVASGRTVVDVAASLGITQSCLYRWKQQDLVDRGLKQGQSTTESAQLAAAERRIRDLEEEVKILRKAAAVEAVVPPKVRFRLLAELHDDGVRTTRACHALGVSKSGYYEWRHRAPSKRAIRHAWLTDLIGQIHQASRGTYGRPRVHAELVLGHGITVGHNTVALLMRRAALHGLPMRRPAKKVPAAVTVSDLVKRKFTRDAPNRLWVTDITEHPPARASCIAAWSWTPSANAWWAGRWTPASRPTWPPTPSGWPSTRAAQWTAPSSTGTTGPSSHPGASPSGPGQPACCPRWVPSAIPTTTL